MSDDRSPESMLRGRLADIYVPALVSGTVDALARRLGNRATVDDPVHGRASGLALVEPMLARASARLGELDVRYEHVASIAGIDRDASEGRLLWADHVLPVAIVAERRRLREIELRVYHAPAAFAPPVARAALTSAERDDRELRAGLVLPVDAVLSALREGAVDRALSSFEEASRAIDASGATHAKKSGALRDFLSGASFDLDVAGVADDGRVAVVEGVLTRDGTAVPTLLALERGESGLVSELRVYA